MKKKIIPIVTAVIMAFALMPLTAGTAHAGMYDVSFDGYVQGLKNGNIETGSTITIDVMPMIEANEQMMTSFFKYGEIDVFVQFYHPSDLQYFAYDDDSGKATFTFPDAFDYTGYFVNLCIDIGDDMYFSEQYNIVAPNTMTVKGKTGTVKYKKLKKKTQYLSRSKVLAIGNNEGTLSFKKVKGNKKITINGSTGKVTVKKKLKKGTYKVYVNVTAAGNDHYNPLTVKKMFKVKVK